MRTTAEKYAAKARGDVTGVETPMMTVEKKMKILALASRERGTA